MVLLLDNSLLKRYGKKPRKVIKSIKKAAKNEEKLKIRHDVDYESHEYASLLNKMKKKSNKGKLECAYNLGCLALTLSFPPYSLILGPVAFFGGVGASYLASKKKEGYKSKLKEYTSKIRSFREGKVTIFPKVRSIKPPLYSK